MTSALERRLQSAALDWVGTPFVPHACIRGAGVDCVHLCGAIYVEAGILEIFDPPKYSIDGGPHSDKPLIETWLEESGRFQRTRSACDHIFPCTCLDYHWPGLQSGDLVTFRIGNRAYHCGIVTEPRTFIHAMRGHGVILSRLDDPTYAKRLLSVWTPNPTGGASVPASLSIT